MKKHIRLMRFLIVTACVLIGMTGAFAVYVSDYYHGNEKAEEALESNDIEVKTHPDGSISFWPEEGTDTGLIFYPGGKVEYTAYAPLMRDYAERGIGCVLLKMPFNLAVFDINEADDVYKEYPDIEEWYIGGHSLGGAMAAVYASRHVDELKGLVLLGAYSTEDLSGSDLKVALIDGSNDEVINHDKAEKSLKNYPESTYSFMILGGNHSQFGSYGFQKGDGEASITPEQQWAETAEDTLKIMQK